jgi:hypothetical protein
MWRTKCNVDLSTYCLGKPLKDFDHVGSVSSHSHITTDSQVGILVSGTHLGPAINFLHTLFDYFVDSFGFVDVGALSDEKSGL